MQHDMMMGGTVGHSKSRCKFFPFLRSKGLAQYQASKVVLHAPTFFRTGFKVLGFKCFRVGLI